VRWIVGRTKEPAYAVDARFVSVNGREIVILSEGEYERLLDIVDAAAAETVLRDPKAQFLKWDEIKHEFTGSRIAEVRKGLGVTQKELARRLRVKQSTVSRWERPDANLTLSTLRRIAKALRCEAHELLA
jgi:DNA-binding transcriptional regulator YiaG